METLEEARIRLMKLAIKKHSCLNAASAALGITPHTLYNYRKKLGLDIASYGSTHSRQKKKKE